VETIDWGAAAIIGAGLAATPFSEPTAEDGAVAVMGFGSPPELEITGAESVAKEPGDIIVL
jgi:hypothetical protein